MKNFDCNLCNFLTHKYIFFYWTYNSPNLKKRYVTDCTLHNIYLGTKIFKLFKFLSSLVTVSSARQAKRSLAGVTAIPNKLLGSNHLSFDVDVLQIGEVSPDSSLSWAAFLHPCEHRRLHDLTSHKGSCNVNYIRLTPHAPHKHLQRERERELNSKLNCPALRYPIGASDWPFRVPPAYYLSMNIGL